MPVDPAPLLLRPRLHPDESLASWLVRLSSANGYCAPDGTGYRVGGRLARKAQSGLVQESKIAALGVPASAAIFARLATLTCMPIAQLHAATPHHFAGLLTSPDHAQRQLACSDGTARPLLPEHWRAGLLHHPNRGGQFCPLCLRDASYHRHIWTAMPVATCHLHDCLLSSGCPSCHAATPVHVIVTRHCRECGADLAATVPAPHPDDRLIRASQATLRDWFLDARTPSPERAGYTLPNVQPHVLFRVIDGLRIRAQASGAGWPYADDLHDQAERSYYRQLPTPSIAIRLYATAFRPLLNWPRGWHHFLEALARQGADRGMPNTLGGTRLGQLYRNWIQHEWAGSEFSWLQVEVDRYLREHHGRDFGFMQIARARGEAFAGSGEYLNVQQALAVLGVPKTILERLLATGRLAAHESRDRREGTAVTMLAKAAVARLRDEIGRWIGRTEAAGIAGLSQQVFDELVTAGRIPVALPAPPGKDVAWRRFDAAAVTSWRNDLLARAVTPTVTGDGPQSRLLTPGHASRIARPLGWTAAAILARVEDGVLTTQRQPEAPSARLDDLRVLESDLCAAIDAERAARGWLSSTAATIQLRCGTRQFAALVRDGTLTPVAVVGKTKYFAREAIDRHTAGRGIDADAAGEILGVSGNTVRAWAGAGRLPTLPAAIPGRGLRFDAAAMAAWRATHLSYGETLVLLGIDQPRMRQLIARGALARVSGDRRGAWFARADVAALATS